MKKDAPKSEYSRREIITSLLQYPPDDLSDAEFVTLLIHIAKGDRLTGVTTLSEKEMAEIRRCSVEAIQQQERSLEDRGYVTIERKMGKLVNCQVSRTLRIAITTRDKP
jgi:DNA-binding transcriptional regulator YhcF (GntR family)